MRTYKVFTKVGRHYVGTVTIRTSEKQKYEKDFLLYEKGV